MRERRFANKRLLAMVLVVLMIQSVMDCSAFTYVSAETLNKVGITNETDVQNNTGSVSGSTVSGIEDGNVDEPIETTSEDSISDDSVSDDSVSENTISEDSISVNLAEEDSTGAGSGDWSKLQATLNAVKPDDIIDLSDYTTPADNKVYTFTAGSGKKFTLKGNGTNISNVAFVFTADNTITIDNLNLESADNHADTQDDTKLAYAPLYFSGTGNTLLLKGSNTIQSGQTSSVSKYGAALGVPSGAELTVRTSSDSTDASLKADSTKDGTVNGSGAGIGGGYEISAGKVTIESGIITAKGGSTGIGGGGLANGGTVIINGGRLTAKGSSGAGIGGSFNVASDGGQGGNVTITGGIITAEGVGGTGIGGGACGKSGGTGGSGGTVTINGGTVRAVGDSICAGIGGGGSVVGTPGGGGTVIINGGSVCATGGKKFIAGSYNSYTVAPEIGGGQNENYYKYPNTYTDGPAASIKNTNGSKLFRNTLTFSGTAQANDAITSCSIGGKECSETPNAAGGVYGIMDVKMDDSKNCYFWLPATSTEEKVSAIVDNGNCFEGTYSRPESYISIALMENCTYRWNALKNAILAKTITVADLTYFSSPEENIVVSIPSGSNLQIKGMSRKFEKVTFLCQGNNNIIIDDLNLKSSDNHADSGGVKGYAPFCFAAGNNTLTFNRTNILTSGQTASQAGYGSAIQVAADASLSLLPGGENAFLTTTGSFGPGMTGGNLTIKGGNIIAKDTAGTCGIHGNVVIQGGSVQAGFDQIPTNGSKSLYLNKLIAPKQLNKSLSAGSIGGVSCSISGSPVTGSYGICGVTTDENGAVYFWLPNSEGKEEVWISFKQVVFSLTYQRIGETEKKLSDPSLAKWDALQTIIDGEGDKTINLSALEAPESPYILSVPENKNLTIISDGIERKNTSFIFKGNNKITIQNLNIRSANLHCNEDMTIRAYSPMQFEKPSTLILRGTNTIRSGQTEDCECYGAAVNVPTDSELVICAAEDEPTASLNAYGGNRGAGIGGGFCWDNDASLASGKITIESGIIYALGGVNGAGIGNGYDRRRTGPVTINGGSVTAEGGDKASGIGRGEFLDYSEWKADVKLTINGGKVTLKEDAEAAYCSTMHTEINGGSVITSNKWKSAPANSAGKGVYKNTLIIPDAGAGVVTSGSVSGIDCMSAVPVNGAFGIKDVKTDKDKKLYFYLPASSEPEVIRLTVDGAKYVTKYLREKDKIYELVMDEVISISIPSVITYGEEWELVAKSKDPTATFQYSYSGQTESGAVYGPSNQKPSEAGKYTAKVTMESILYSGSEMVAFTIIKKELTQDMISISENTIVYNGSPQKPGIIVKTEKKVFARDQDYTVEYSNNMNAGTAIATIRGKGNCTGIRAFNFTISKAVPESLVWPVATEITYGEQLSESTLSGGSATGIWTWEKPELVPSAGSKGCEVIFTPNDINNYDWSDVILRKTVSVKVNKASNLEILSEPTINAKDGQDRVYIFYLNNIILNKPDTGKKTYLAEMGDNTDNILSEIQVSGNELMYHVANSAAEGNLATIKLTIQTENYTDQTAMLTIHVSQKDTQNIVFDTEYDQKTYGEDNFSHTAILRGAGGTGAITYSIGDSKVATVDPNTGEVSIVGAGMTTIIAKKASDESWSEATAGYGLKVDKKTVTITADDKTIIIGRPQPVYTYTKSGFINGEDLIKEPIVTCPGFRTDMVGTYSIIPDKAAVSDNYWINYVNGTLTLVNGYGVTVTKGTGSGKYIEGQTVTITADKNSGYTFTGWTGSEGVTFDNKKATTTTFIMPKQDVTVGADYNSNDHYLISKEIADTFDEKADKKGYATVSLKKTDYVYTGAEIRPVPVVNFTYTEYNDSGEKSGKVKTKKLIENVDYALTYSNNSNVGQGIVFITGLGDYKNTMNQEFTITPKTIKKAVIEPIEDMKANGSDLKSQVEERIIVKDGVNTISSKDYNVSYQVDGVDQPQLKGSTDTNTVVTVSITGKNNYMDTIKKTQTFTILPQNSAASSAADDFVLTLKVPKKIYTYSGKENKPQVVVTSISGNKLKANKDYKISYSDNVNAGSGTVTVSGKNNYYGSESIFFTIQPKEISKVKIKSLSKISFRETIEDLELWITDGSRYLENHLDYEVDLSGSKDLSLGSLKTKKITLSVNAVSGGNYKGTKTVTCYIVPRSLTNRITTKIECPAVIYTESIAKDGAKPIPVIQYNGDKLVPGIDFTVKYSGNKKVGTGKAVIQGIGNYSGKRTVTFLIIKE